MRRSGCSSVTSSRKSSPERLGGWVVSAPQCPLGSGVEQRAFGGEAAFVVVGVQQAGRRPAVDLGGQLPAEVDAVDHAGVEGHASGGKQVGGVAGQQDPPVAISLDVSSVIGEARQAGRFSQGQIHAQHAADAVPELGQGHRLVVVVVGGLLLAGVDPQERRIGRPGGEHTALGWCETERDPAHPRDLDVAVVEHGHRLGHGGLTPAAGSPGRWCRGTGCRPGRAPGCCAPSQPTRYRAVTWYVPSGPRTSAVTAASSWLSPTTSCPRRISAPSSPASSPSRRSSCGCGSMQQLHRRVGQAREVHVHAAERQPESRAGGTAGCFESFQQPSVAQHLQDLPAETSGLRDVPDLRVALEHQRSHSGQAQLNGEHQAGWAGAHDDHIAIHFATPGLRRF